MRMRKKKNLVPRMEACDVSQILAKLFVFCYTNM